VPDRIGPRRALRLRLRVRRWWRRLAWPVAPADIAVAQLSHCARHLPPAYLIILANMTVTGALCFATSPTTVTIGLLLAAGVFGWRAVRWHRRVHAPPTSLAAARAALSRATALAPAISIALLGWSLALLPDASLSGRAAVILGVPVTVIGCVFCLTYLPRAAVLSAGTVVAAELLYGLWTGDTGAIAVAGELALVTLVMLRTVRESFATFVESTRARAALIERGQEAERLGSEAGRLAHLDSLTGLPNRRWFLTQLDALVAARPEGFALGMLDLDRFKPVNDVHGHAVGDRLLAEVGARLREVADGRVLVARLGGDEFGLMIPLAVGDPGAFGRRLCARLGEPYAFDDLTLSIGCSVGIALYPHVGESSRELFERADFALYSGKVAGRGACTLFTVEHEHVIRSGQVLEAALLTADLATEMDLVFQPIVDVDDGRAVAVEALARWHSPILGDVSPDRFIPVAESLGMMGRLSLALFDRALAEVSALPPGIAMSFNLSTQDICSEDTVAGLIDRIDGAGVDPRRIVFEVTETSLMRNFDVAVATITRLRARGIRIALDDFGTGFSSLTQLRRLPLDRVKLDRSFAGATGDDAGRMIVAAIAGLCRNLQLPCVMEGVETPEQLLRARQFGYRYAQGYYIAPPLGMAALLDWLAAPAADYADAPASPQRCRRA